MKLTYLFLILPFWVSAQSAFKRDNTALRNGNSAYEKQDYTSAINEYQKALTINKNNEKAAFNLGDALYQDKKYKEAAQQFDKVAGATQDKELKAKSYYNQGNAYYEQKEYEKAVNAYKNVLKINPQDKDAQYNLSRSYVQYKKENKPENQNQDDKSYEDDPNGKEKIKEDPKGDKKLSKPDPNGNEKKNEQGQPSQQGQNAKMSEADAQRLLDALKSEEEKVRQRYQKTRSAGRPPLNSGKDW